MPATESQMSLFAGSSRTASERSERGRSLAMVIDHRAWLEFVANEWWPLGTDESVQLWAERPRVRADGNDRVVVVAWLDQARLPNSDVYVRRSSEWTRIPLSDLTPTDDSIVWPGPIPLFSVSHFSVQTEADSKRLLAMAKGFANVGAPTHRITIEPLDSHVSERSENLPRWLDTLRPPRAWNAARGAAAIATWALPAMEPWAAALCGALSLKREPSLFTSIAAPWWSAPLWSHASESIDGAGSELWRSLVDVILSTDVRAGWRPLELLELVAIGALSRGASQTAIGSLVQETRAILADERPVGLTRSKTDPVGLSLQLVLLRPSLDRYIEWRKDLPGLPPGVWWTGAAVIGALTGYKDLEPSFRGNDETRKRLAIRTWQLMDHNRVSVWSKFASAPTFHREPGVIQLLWDDVVWGERAENGRGWWLHADLSNRETRAMASDIARRYSPNCLRIVANFADVDLKFVGGRIKQTAEDVVSVSGSSKVRLPASAVEWDLDEDAFRYWLVVDGIPAPLPLPQGSLKSSTTRTATHASEGGSEQVPGLRLIQNFISESEEQQLLAEVDAAEWSTEMSRRVQHYGWRYRYKERSVSPSDKLGPLPPWATVLAQRLLDRGLVSELPDQVIVNEYKGKQGISKHIDCLPCFRGAIAMISLLEPWEMNFWPPQGEKVARVLDTRSVAVITGPARETWMHEIPSRKREPWGERQRRVSLTFRKVNPSSVKNISDDLAPPPGKTFLFKSPTMEISTLRSRAAKIVESPQPSERLILVAPHGVLNGGLSLAAETLLDVLDECDRDRELARYPQFRGDQSNLADGVRRVSEGNYFAFARDGSLAVRRRLLHDRRGSGARVARGDVGLYSCIEQLFGALRFAKKVAAATGGRVHQWTFRHELHGVGSRHLMNDAPTEGLRQEWPEGKSSAEDVLAFAGEIDLRVRQDELEDLLDNAATRIATGFALHRTVQNLEIGRAVLANK